MSPAELMRGFVVSQFRSFRSFAGLQVCSFAISQFCRFKNRREEPTGLLEWLEKAEKLPQVTNLMMWQ